MGGKSLSFLTNTLFLREKKDSLVKQSVHTYLLSMGFSRYYKAFRALRHSYLQKKLNECE